jgi:hypothetical protein
MLSGGLLRLPGTARWLVALVAGALVVVGCGASRGGGGGAAAAAASGAGNGSGFPPPLPATGRFKLGVAATAVPAGWQLVDGPGMQEMRQSSLAGGSELDGFTLVHRNPNSDSAADAFPSLSIAEATGSSRPSPGETLAAQKRANAAAAAGLAQDGFSGYQSLADTTVDGIPATVSEVTQASTGPEGTTVVRDCTIGVVYHGQGYTIEVSARGTSIPQVDLAALNTLRASWRWQE